MDKPDFFKMAIDRNLYLAAPEVAEMCEHVWNTHVVPLQEDNKQLMSDQDILANDLKNTLEREEALIESVIELESEIKALREEIERLKINQPPFR